MEKALLTVLMPVYNAEKFLQEAIDSILAQTFTRFEFLIIDDASTDSSPAIIQSYTDARIRYIRNERNLGISATLNRGIELSNTEWIARMDADDISYPERLEKQFAFCEQHPDCTLLSCWTRVITEDKQVIRTEKYNSRYYYYNLTFECWVYHPTILFRKNAVNYTVPYAEDFELLWQLMRKYKIYNLPEVLLDYRVTSASLHQVTKKKEYEEAMTEQVIRNIQFYAPGLPLSPAQLECLRHNFQPLLQENNVSSIIGCLRKLQIINRGILSTENINNDPVAIKEAAYFKRLFILTWFSRHLSKPKAIALLARTNSWRLLFRLMAGFMKKRMK
ncbi:MAG TPA: glycosyltransferase [Chitinophagaceae bacterium]|nr:glycosyltransferase [Chitinophagaceae bacterium]